MMRWCSARSSQSLVHQRRGLIIGVLTRERRRRTARLPAVPGAHGTAVRLGTAVPAPSPSPRCCCAGALLMREQPQDVGSCPTATAGRLRARRLARNPIAAAFEVLGRAAVTRDFWLLAATVLHICGASTTG